MMFKPGDRVRVREGTLAHLEGQVLSHEEAQRRFDQAGRAMLPDRVVRGCVWVELIVHRGRLTANGAVETLLDGTDWLVAPNSAAVGSGGEVYIGARQYVAVFDPKAKASALRLLVPGREFLRPER